MGFSPAIAAGHNDAIDFEGPRHDPFGEALRRCHTARLGRHGSCRGTADFEHSQTATRVPTKISQSNDSTLI
jgi:hypothetical protein